MHLGNWVGSSSCINTPTITFFFKDTHFNTFKLSSSSYKPLKFTFILLQPLYSRYLYTTNKAQGFWHKLSRWNDTPLPKHLQWSVKWNHKLQIMLLQKKQLRNTRIYFITPNFQRDTRIFSWFSKLYVVIWDSKYFMR